MDKKDKEASKIVKEVIFSSYDYMDKNLGKIQSLADEFYKEPDSESWNDLKNLIEVIQWFFQSVKNIDSIKNLEKIVVDYENWNNYVGELLSLKENFAEMNEAISKKDNILIGDIIKHEFLPSFTKMHEYLINILDKIEEKNNA